ncbi:ArsR/SmtB family transcription factor [Paenibacillus sp. FSL R7-0331]|uniref:ArsR/SmtB family transcription factor n=1 Tax=Paenibacillus sp. FSL R7-0331 TaxID=1536773 RepID=UPI0004F7BE52|nr:metalloregulator ArsR/SmtB family transcription factor [Paenibacillus sp. FSL R7-0331]AIQ55476.1 ArsR family transcriptional regulator [Paenibacillus sp. FSL R7-0331]
MKGNSNVALIASLLSEPSRAAILTVLLDGRFHAASELAYIARIKPQTASFHLSKLVDANIVTVEKQGRHRYYGIQNQEVAQVMESLLSIAPPVEIRSLRQSTEDKALRYARTCYDHLAGSLGVQLTEALLGAGILHEDQDNFAITEQGHQFFADFDIDVDRIKQQRRSFSHKCLDWSERRHHLAGALGNALLERLLELDWLRRLPETRAIQITAKGITGIAEIFSLELDT